MIEKIWLRCVKNLSNVYLAREENINPHFGILGRNNQGKTNILEGIYFGLNGASLDKKGLSTFVQTGQPIAYTQLQTMRHSHPFLVSATINSDTKKTISINKKMCRSFKQIQSYLVAQYISVDTIRIFKDSADARRKDLDKFGCFFSTEYAAHFKQYERALKQRNKLIKKQATIQDIAIWDRLCIEHAPPLIQSRQRLMKRLIDKMNALLQQVPVEDLAQLDGRYIYQSLAVDRWEDYSKQYEKELKKRIERDRIMGYTTIGPQRDDFHICSQGKWVVTYGSRGMNQIIAILWKVAQVQLLIETKEVKHVILLDDALAELDRERAQNIMDVLSDHAQIIFATAQKVSQSLLPEANWYTVEKGHVFKCDTIPNSEF